MRLATCAILSWKVARQSEEVLASQAIDDGDLRILFVAERPPVSTTTKGTFMPKECLSWIHSKKGSLLTRKAATEMKSPAAEKRTLGSG